MAIINQRWPPSLCPNTCEFGRSRNDVVQKSPRTRQETVIKLGRPLWSAKLSWRVPHDARVHALRYWLDGLQGAVGSTLVWDFSAPSLENLAPGGVPSHWVTGATATAAASPSGVSAITLSGLQASSIVTVTGMHIQVGRRLYIAASGAVSDAAGGATVQLTTPLVSAVASGDVARLAQAACEMHLTSGSWSGGRTASGLYSISAEFLETVEDY